MNIKTAIYRAAFALRHPEAISIWRRGVDYDQYRRLNQPWLKSLDIRTVFDIGGNVGQFARLVHATLPEATIYSFEPLPDCHRELAKALGGFKSFQAFNYALGDAGGELDFWRSPHTPSSSFLPMTSAHEAAYPESRHSTKVRVQVRALDDVARQLSIQDGLFVKIDVQGYEGPVLRGGEETLRRAALVMIETSFVPLYREQLLFSGVLARMEALGFRFFGNLAQHGDPHSGCALFADSLFVGARWADRVHG
jgi:FkbM family methyltransferase